MLSDFPVKVATREDLEAGCSFDLNLEDGKFVLLVLPAMSNFCGAKFPVGRWIQTFKNRSV